PARPNSGRRRPRWGQRCRFRYVCWSSVPRFCAVYERAFGARQHSVATAARLATPACALQTGWASIAASHRPAPRGAISTGGRAKNTKGSNNMRSTFRRHLVATAAGVAILAGASAASAQEVKIGILLGYTGPIESLTP